MGEGSKTGESPKVLRRGCKRSFGPSAPKASCTGAKESCSGAKQGCTWCKRLLRDLCAVGPKDLLHPVLTTFGDSPLRGSLFQRFSEVFKRFSEVFRGFSETLSETLSEADLPLRGRSPSQRLSVLLPLIVLPLETYTCFRPLSQALWFAKLEFIRKQC